MTGPRFQRRVENFSCGNCGRAVTGSGFTNHCPACLWSKHVDIAPGDRAADCGGLMRPVSVRYERGAYELLHQCGRCGARKPNKASPRDDTDVLISLMSNPFEY